jgi:F-type H+-transporting ATPase subunit b
MAGDTSEHLGAEVLAQAEVGMPQLDFAHYPNMIFWLIVSLVVLYLILSKIALPRISTVLAERNDAISNDLEMAALYKRRAVEAEEAYNAALAKAREESQKIAAETKVQINKDLDVLMAKADAEISAKAAESEKRIQEIQESAAKSVEEVARDTAAGIVNAIMPATADDAALSAAIINRLKG